ncbi:MAG: 4Fe-4S binding protein [Phycisphaerales bacterium]
MASIAAPSRNVPLKVLDERGIARSRNAPRRAIVLGLIQLLIIVHIGLWLAGAFGGRTTTPIEPSEAMQTLERGYVNAGFIFFSLALLSTLVFGRVFCGWGCHIVMLQDFCGWIMKKCGVRPKPFRSRTLIWVPLAVALYMFVWPTIRRLAIVPVLERLNSPWLVYFSPTLPWELQNHMITTDFWQTFPIVMAVPTLLIVGFAAVYVLGAKGFCTYGCPYGGFFAPLDEFARGRIIVDPDRCEQCGHCTATCTSNVRVHEEVKTYGMVMDSGCMKCMDCISVCPNDALRYGFAKPAKVEKKDRPRKQYDFSLVEDILLACLFLLILLAVRGMYLWEGVPFLMAVAVAGIGGYFVILASRLLRKRFEILRLQQMKLKWRGRITAAGWLTLAGVSVFVIFVAQAGVVRWHQWRGEIAVRNMAITTNDVFSFERPPLPDETRELAQRAVAHYSKTFSIADGGLALLSDPALAMKRAWPLAVLSEFKLAEQDIRTWVDAVGPSDRACTDIMRLMMLDGRTAEAVAYADAVLRAHPDFAAMNLLRSAIEAQ